MSFLFESKGVGKGSFAVRWNQMQDPYGHLQNIWFILESRWGYNNVVEVVIHLNLIHLD